MNKRQYLESISKEELVTRLLNAELEEAKLRNKLLLLAGCSVFGDCDGTDGSCVECMYKTPYDHARCRAFRDSLRQFSNEKDKIRKSRQNAPVRVMYSEMF